jgi:hypothetical protein
MKKSFAWFLFCCCLITLATSCGGGDKPKPAPKSTPAGGE